jgi:rhamnogalacturonyl hydrolase YesR
VARDPATGLYAHEWDGQDKTPFNVFPAAASAALALGAHAQLLNKLEM